MRTTLLGLLLSLSLVQWGYSQTFYGPNGQTAEFLGRYTDGRSGACEISSYNPYTQQLITTNSASDSIDFIDWSDLTAPVKVGGTSILPYGASVNSLVVVDTHYIAVAIGAAVKQDSGKVVIFDNNGQYVTHVTVGALPDMITQTPDGQKLLVACEGEPSDDYLTDPEGHIAIIDLSVGAAALTQAQVTLLDLRNAPASIPGGVFKPGTPYAQDLEPEYITVSRDGQTAKVVCQENNVLITVDLTADTIVSYHGLGFKDHSLIGAGFDASDRDNAINIQPHPVKGVYQPDAIATFEHPPTSQTYYVTANEGDARDYGGYRSEARVGDLTLDPVAFPNAATLQQDSELGRLKTFTTDALGDTDGDGDTDELYSYGGRSISIWDETGTLVWDSGDAIEQYMAIHHRDFFNCNDGLASKQDNRSDDKGPEPEAIAIWDYNHPITHPGATSPGAVLVGLERQGGVLLFDLQNHSASSYPIVLHIHSYDTVAGTSIDVGPEDIDLHSESSGQSIVWVSYEESGTIAAYRLTQLIVDVDAVATPAPARIYPNPVEDRLHLEQAEGLVYEIYNGLGQQMAVGRCTESTTAVDVRAWQAGWYVVRLSDETGRTRSVEQIVKQ